MSAPKKTAPKENARWQAGVDTAKHFSPKGTAVRIFKQCVKRLIVCAALWGVIPPSFATRLLSRLGLVVE